MTGSTITVATREKEAAHWPTETSIGRWFHSVGYDLEDQQ
jgi:hypothetical protein